MSEGPGGDADVFSDFRYLKKNLMWSFLCAYVIEYVTVGKTLFSVSFVMEILWASEFCIFALLKLYNNVFGFSKVNVRVERLTFVINLTIGTQVRKRKFRK